MNDSHTLVLVGIILVLAYLLFHLKMREAAIRQDSLRRSQSVVAGKATEHLAPLLPGFEFDPRDARFLGSPIDFIVFDGLSEGEVSEIVRRDQDRARRRAHQPGAARSPGRRGPPGPLSRSAHRSLRSGVESFPMDKETVHIVAHLVAREGEEARVLAELEKLIEPTRAEPGCLDELFVNQEKPGDFVFVEEYASRTAFQAHMDSKHVGAAIAQAVPLLGSPPDIRRYRRLR
jgi:quinol monooxygenase YgiN